MADEQEFPVTVAQLISVLRDLPGDYTISAMVPFGRNLLAVADPVIGVHADRDVLRQQVRLMFER